MRYRIENRFYIYLLMLFLFGLDKTFPHTNEHKRAREYSFKFKRLNIQDGVPQNRVNCIVQDNKGFMWFDTQEGLNRYDKQRDRFIRYRVDPNNPYSLSSNRVSAIYEDKKGRVESGQLQLESIGFDPEVIAFDVRELMKLKIGAKSVKIICRISNKVPSNVKGESR